jgi:hypothetical protein
MMEVENGTRFVVSVSAFDPSESRNLESLTNHISTLPIFTRPISPLTK